MVSSERKCSALAQHCRSLFQCGPPTFSHNPLPAVLVYCAATPHTALMKFRVACNLLVAFCLPLAHAFAPQPLGRGTRHSLAASFPDPSIISDAAKSLDGINGQLSDSFNAILTDGLKEFSSIEVPLANELGVLGNQINDSLQAFLQQHPELTPYYNVLQQAFSGLKLQVEGSPQLILLLSSVTTYWVFSSILSIGEEPPPSKPYPLQKYDPVSARAYYDKRLPQVIKRGLEVSIQSLKFGVNLLKDYLEKKLDENANVRAVELAQLLTKLGPSFIKIGQSLSIRTDLLSPAYVRGLQTLQDQCPPFNSNVAKQMMEEEWGVPIDSVLSDISDEPVAAASLGQVYKATMKDGTEVAIKVQRPNIMNQIALDMHLLREIAPLVKRAFNLNTDLVGTVDAWGAGFVDELN